MSANSPVIRIETTAPAQAPFVVRAAVSRLAFKRKLWRAVAVVAFALACALALLCLLGAVDYVRPLPRVVRIIIVVPSMLFCLLVFTRALWQLTRRVAPADAAREVERAAGVLGNALVTFCETDESGATGAGVAASYMLARLSRQATDELAAFDERVVAPRGNARRGALALACVLLFMLGARALVPQAFALEARRLLRLSGDDEPARSTVNALNNSSAGGAEAAVTLEELRVRVVPPAYSGLGAEDAPGDAPIRALVGSQVEVTLRARGPIGGASLSFNGASVLMRSLDAGRFSGIFTASASGAFEARVLADEKLAPAPFVRAVEVYADAQPEARITEPGGDQLLRSVPAAPVGVRWTARDDLGLADVRLKYIKSHGEGDAAKFTNGEASLGSVERASVREWRGAAALDLARLGVQAGDTLVFWIEARDRNPGSNNTGRSASLAIAIRAPEAAKLNLSDLLPNEIARFLLSERQIIIKTEKLHAERSRLAQDELLRRANDIAADQRDFKNSFNDYIKIEGAGEDEGTGAGAGGTSVEEQVRAAEDERVAPHFHGIPEPPTGTPAAVREMVYAIRAMWDAEDALTIADTTKALTHEREALALLKRAQTAVRYIPPIVAQSKPVDLKRRYAGELEEIRTRLEKLARQPESKETARLRAALAGAYAALGDLQATLNAPAGARASATTRARERSRQAADSLVSVGGDHAATVAEAMGQLRIVETELARLETNGTAEEYAARLSRPLALLTQAAANLFALAERKTRSKSNDAGALLPADEGRAADYFRRLSGGK
jgi:hypothetical protein